MEEDPGREELPVEQGRAPMEDPGLKINTKFRFMERGIYIYRAGIYILYRERNLYLSSEEFAEEKCKLSG